MRAETVACAPHGRYCERAENPDTLEAFSSARERLQENLHTQPQRPDSDAQR